MHYVLVLEDEVDLASALCKMLESEHYHTNHFTTLEEALKAVHSKEYDVCLIDINLPDGNGNDLIKEIRKHDAEIGIIVISSDHAISNKIRSLDLGADDYLVKPFDFSELHARVRRAAKRKENTNDIEENLSFNEISINLAEHVVTVDGNFLKLTKKEYELLVYFMNNINRLVTKETLVSHLWFNLPNYENHDFIYAHVKNLRKKLLKYGAKDYIKNIHSVGYKFTEEHL